MELLTASKVCRALAPVVVCTGLPPLTTSESATSASLISWSPIIGLLPNAIVCWFSKSILSGKAPYCLRGLILSSLKGMVWGTTSDRKSKLSYFDTAPAK